MTRIEYLIQVAELKIQRRENNKARMSNNFDPEYLDGIIDGLGIMKRAIERSLGYNEDTMQFIIDHATQIIKERN
jgi:hypothetical protein